jgi:hypothetical protein
VITFKNKKYKIKNIISKSNYILEIKMQKSEINLKSDHIQKIKNTKSKTLFQRVIIKIWKSETNSKNDYI